MADRSLEGRTAIITGAGRGLGKAMAKGLAAQGAKIALIDLEEQILSAAVIDVEAAGGRGCALPVTADVADPTRAHSAVNHIIEALGGFDILINDAAMGPQFFTDNFVAHTPKFWEHDVHLWHRVLTVNAYGPQLMATAAAPHLVEKQWGRIINVTTSLDTMYLRGCGAYGPSKAALEANTRIMAQDLNGTGVTANVLIPGGPANTRMIPEATGFDRDELVQPEVMQAPACWLCSTDADDISNMRFIAAMWDDALPREDRIKAAGAPTAWAQINSVAKRPDLWEEAER
ncbi:MAG: SDR family oxidoreductase [Pseudomonadota bacterium]|nr:SDR family oxidoreductase [Pseudomonadota bacterium]